MIARNPRAGFRDALRQSAVPVRDPRKLDQLFDLIGEARIVMLGEASHGTSEFYEYRRMISERLIRDHGFSFIAVEGDWPDCQRVHAHITQGTGSPREALAGYRRFPTWMWGNEEVLELVEWLRGFNEAISKHPTQGKVQSPKRQSPKTQASTTDLSAPDNLDFGHLDFGPSRSIGFHGLDVYSLYDSLKLVIEYLRRVDPNAVTVARKAYECFERFGEDPQHYAYGLRFVPASSEREVVASLSHLDRLRDIYSRINPDHVDPGEAYFDARMNALVTQNAEAYYRTLIGGDAPSWNVRDRHMIQTLELLLDHYGRDSRAIVWAHNTHIGDYRATDMKRAGYVNLGGLAREQFGGDAVRLIGFGTHRGTVMAAHEWGEPPQIMNVPKAMDGSLEDLMHQVVVDGLDGHERRLPGSGEHSADARARLNNNPDVFIPLRDLPPAIRYELNITLGHRAIGVVYEPRHERHGQYVPTQLADRYDGFFFIDGTRAVHPLDIAVDVHEEPEAWPSGL
jgi:erythromycin esterase